MRTINAPSRPRAQLSQLAAAFAWLALVLLGGLLAGCAHTKETFVPQPTPQPPTFLNGPMALLLTNTSGFRAHVTLETGTPPRQLAAGDLMGKGAHLLFAPTPAKVKKKEVSAADSAFLWNVATNHGYLLNDPLQAYAPCSSSLEFTNVTLGIANPGAAPERIAGHRCQPAEAIVTSNDGSLSGFRVWQAADLGGLPLRIVSTASGLPVTLTLSKPQLVKLPDDLFQPPSGFTRYESGEALVNELVSRQHNIHRRPGGVFPDLEPGPLTTPPVPGR
jgi:hypothetical protein